MGSKPLAILIISDDRAFIEDSAGVFMNLAGAGHAQVQCDFENTQLDIGRMAWLTDSPVYRNAQIVAQSFLLAHTTPPILVFQASTFQEAVTRITAKHRESEFALGMIVLDETTVGDLSYERTGLIQAFDDFYSQLGTAGVEWIRSSYSIIAYTAAFPFLSGGAYLPPLRYLYRVRPQDTSLLRADLLCCFMDFYELTFLNTRARRGEKNRDNVTLALELVAFLNNRSQPREWDCYYYTGSIVSSLIETIEKALYQQNQFCFMGPNEHSLACGAMANWKLYARPFLIVVTSAMADEFKGTLANLREARAKGFIVVAENREDAWFPFQGTRTQEENMMDVIKAKKLPAVYLKDSETLATDLQTAFEFYESGEGPVFLFVTQQVLQSKQPLSVAADQLYPKPKVVVPAPSSPQTEQDFEKIVRLLNEEKTRIIWQVGQLSEEEYNLTIEIADAAGLALCDNLSRPGNVSKYKNGQLVPQYLGTLSLYGFSQRAFRYMHNHGKLNPKDSQVLFFFKSKISQINSPFSESAMKNKLRIGQISANPTHLARFVDFPCAMDSLEFLRKLRRALNVKPEVRAFREETLKQLPFTTGDIVSKVATQPLHPNYFFSELNQIVEELIVKEGYDYTGVYDVGRNGVSGYRNVARTRPGFSGWYGRALMGDALLSVNALAVTSPVNILAFVGDGARGVVPDIRASMVENIAHMYRPGAFRKNITIFYMINGLVGLINTYQERMMSHRARRQMRCVSLLDPDVKIKVGDLTVQQRNLYSFDADFIRESLLAPGQLNFFSVITNHNNTGDGMSLLAADNWQEI